MSDDASSDGNGVEAVYDRGDGMTDDKGGGSELSDWMLSVWKEAQSKSKWSGRPPTGWIEPLAGDAPRANNAVRAARGSDAPPSDGPLARGSAPLISVGTIGGPADATYAIAASDVIAAIEAIDAIDACGDASEANAAEDVPEVSRKVKSRPRHRRRDRPRSKTIALKRLTRDELRRGALENPVIENLERPTTRAECSDAPRPCPWVACKHHLYLDINPKTGSIKINFPDLEPWEMKHTCALDVADSGGLTLEEIGLITNLTRERVRQVEVRGLLTLKARSGTLK